MRRPWFAFYVDDFETSGRVKLMTNAEKGCYVTLLSYQWREGYVPSEVADLARICGEPPAVFKKYWRRLEHCFPVGADGVRRNKRQEAERAKAEEVSHRQRTNVSKRYDGGRPSGRDSGSEVEALTVIHKSHVTRHTSPEAVRGNPVISNGAPRKPERIAGDVERLTRRAQA